jgi:hypothetical protein
LCRGTLYIQIPGSTGPGWRRLFYIAIKSLDKSRKKEKEIPVECSVPWYKILYQEIREDAS